jgi:hypothetical protein
LRLFYCAVGYEPLADPPSPAAVAEAPWLEFLYYPLDKLTGGYIIRLGDENDGAQVPNSNAKVAATICPDVDRCSNYVSARRIKDSGRGPEQPASADVLGAEKAGTKVRLPVTAWPEIAGWVMMRKPSLQAGEQQRRDLRIRGLTRLQLEELRGTLEPSGSGWAIDNAHSFRADNRAHVQSHDVQWNHQIRKLRSYRQESLRSVHNTLITKDISFRV